MKKTLAQIQYEMETVKLIKDVMEVDGKGAYKLMKEWTSDEPKVEEDAYSLDVTKNAVIQETLNNAFESSKSIAESLISVIDAYHESAKKKVSDKDNSLKILNQYSISADIKRAYTGVTPTFYKGDNVEILFSTYDDRKPFNIDMVDEATVVYSNANGVELSTECGFDRVDGVKVVKYKVDATHMAKGLTDIKLVLKNHGNILTFSPIKLLVLEK